MAIEHGLPEAFSPDSYDAIIVGAGYAGAVCARRLAESCGFKVCVLERRDHIAGNAYDCYDEAGVLIHQYGPHIYHTTNERVHQFLSRFTEWTPYQHKVLADIHGTLMPVPFNHTSLKLAFGDEKGEALSEMGDMVAHGAVMFTDDGRGVQSAGMMRRVMDYAAQFGKAVSSHCQDESLVGKGQINEGVVSTRLGLLGWPATGEEIQIARDIEISSLTGCPIHIQHLSSAHGLDLVRRGKADGVKVTCEVTPHHMFLTEECIGDDYNTNFKVNPPLRTAADAEAVIAGVVDGTVDCIVTDHAPHAAHEKAREFELAPFGMTGIETSVGCVVGNLVNTGKITWERMVELMSVNPRRILGIDRVAIEAGSRADLTVIDPNLKWTVTEEEFESKAQNSGFIGWELTGRATDVYVGGYATMEDGKITEEPIHL